MEKKLKEIAWTCFDIARAYLGVFFFASFGIFTHEYCGGYFVLC